jgi:D-sedoheptulose 7-phosphate isomerase
LSTIEQIRMHLSEAQTILAQLPLDPIARVVELLKNARSQGRRIFIFGNGGSASTASHFASDLAKGAISKDQPRLRAFALSDNTPLMTAWANDKAYEFVFAEQLENYLDAGDVAIGISGSGNSPNVLRAMQVAREKGATTIGITGFGGGKLKNLVDAAVIVPSYNMERVEDVHLLIEHMITACLREGT